MSQFKVLLATSPFGATGRKPLDLLEATGWELVRNPKGRRLKAGEVGDMIADVDAVIAGTEPYTREELANASKLKVIARVGIGLDSVDLVACGARNITVTYTPDAPSQAVAELTIGHMLNLARSLGSSDRSVREGAWNRFMGRLMCEMTIGVIGVGRIGKRVMRLLRPFEPRVLACDLEPDSWFDPGYEFEWCDHDRLLREADLVTLHIPLNKSNRHFMNREKFGNMKTASCLVNTSRGGIVDTQALTDAVLQQHLAGAALDVFEQEPYAGPLTRCDNVVFSAHMGASARKSRYMMELGAAEDCIRALRGEAPANPAPPPEE